MPAFYFRQPNNLYGRFSTIVDSVTNYNMNEQELLQNMKEHMGVIVPSVFKEFLTATKEKRSPYGYIHDWESTYGQICSYNETNKSVRAMLRGMGMSKEEANLYYFDERPNENASDEEWDNYDRGLHKRSA